MINIFYIVGASQGFLLSVFLFFKKERKLYLPLIVIVFLASFQLLTEYLYLTDYIVHIPHLIYLSEPTNTLCGVLLYLFFRNISEKRPTYRRSDILLFIPFLISFTYFIPTYCLSAVEKIAKLKGDGQAGITSLQYLCEWSFELAANLPFLIFSIILLKKYEENVKNEYTNIATITYPLARLLLLVFILLYGFESLAVVLAFMGIDWMQLTYDGIYFLTTSIIYLIGYEVLVHRGNQNITYLKPLNHDTPISIDATKYNRNILSEERVHHITQKILKCMEADSLYRSSELRLTHLAQKVEENPNTVSQIINDVFKQNFYDYVNNYRIEEAKRLLKSPDFQNYSIMAIGEEVGFNSKSTFYSAFKKNTSCTPLQYQNLETIKIT